MLCIKKKSKIKNFTVSLWVANVIIASECFIILLWREIDSPITQGDEFAAAGYGLACSDFRTWNNFL